MSVVDTTAIINDGGVPPGELFIGSVAEMVVRHCTKPVFIIPTKL